MIGKESLFWKSKHPDQLPDFIIGGAMKSGTTTLHGVLESHPDVFMAHDELGFFDIDNVLQHSDYHFYDKTNGSWQSPLLFDKKDELWSWYYSKFTTEKKVLLKGEDSTTYLASPKVASRILLQDKPIKLIFILRHPTFRTISNYLHALKSGRAIYSLEDTLKYDPNSILRRSLYKEQLTAYYEVLPPEQIKIVLFEDMVANKESFFKDVSSFLGLDYAKFDPTVFESHFNKTKTPKYLKLQLFHNRLMQKKRDLRYASFLPLSQTPKKLPLSLRFFDKLHKKINPLGNYPKTSVSEGTLRFLNAYFKNELMGLDELTGMRILSKWFDN